MSGAREGGDSAGGERGDVKAWPRTSGRIYQLRPEHFAILSELDRLFPQRAPIVEMACIPPGAESVETVAAQLFEALKERFEQPLFVAFCNVNAERVLDAIAAILDRGAFPLARDDVLAEVYVRLYDRLRRGGRPGRSGARVAIRWREPRGHWTIYDMLAAAAESVVSEQIELLAACELPLPGLNAPEFDPGDGALERTHALLQARGIRLPGKTVQHWVAHALLRVTEADRRLLYLREKRELPIDEIAKEIGATAFETAARLKRAVASLEERILRTALAFGGDASEGTATGTTAPSSPSPASGRLLTLRPDRESGPRPPSSLEEDHDES